MKWFTVDHIESFRGKRPNEFLNEILKHKGNDPVFGIMDDAYAEIRKTYLSEPPIHQFLDSMHFEELCAFIESLPEPQRTQGMIIVNAKKSRIAKADCTPCEKAKAEAALRTWLKTSGRQK